LLPRTKKAPQLDPGCEHSHPRFRPPQALRHAQAPAASAHRSCDSPSDGGLVSSAGPLSIILLPHPGSTIPRCELATPPRHRLDGARERMRSPRAGDGDLSTIPGQTSLPLFFALRRHAASPKPQGRAVSDRLPSSVNAPGRSTGMPGATNVPMTQTELTAPIAASFASRSN